MAILRTRLLQSLPILIFALAFPRPAGAQATRTWVSGVGDDANPCSRTAPCKTFAGAISKTAINGEIDVLDPGGFGAVTITKSITIDGTGTFASILASSTTGITINITTTAAQDPLATVRLRGLSINGAGACAPPPCGTRTGIRGINVSSANARNVKLFVDNVWVQGFVNEGLLFNGPGGDLSVKDSSFFDNGGSGIRVLSNAAGQTGIVHVTVDRTHTSNNQQGVRFEGNAFGVVIDSVASSNSLNGYVVNPTTLGNAEMNVVGSTTNNNRQFGVFAGSTGFAATVRIIDVTAIHNSSQQLQINPGGQICTNQRNHIGVPSMAPNCTFADQ
jgi:hypothetical protein